MEITLEIDDKRVTDLLISAFEGGSNYWIYKTVGDYTQVLTQKIEIVERETSKTWRLYWINLIQGMQIMADKYPKHFANFMADKDDAETADVFLQCALWGQIIYG